MKPLNDIVQFIKSASIGTKDAVDEDVLQRMHAAYDDSSRGRGTEHMGRRVARLAIAAGVLIAVGAAMSYLAQLAGGNVAWAEVSRQFKAVPFFSATIYRKDNATAEPTQMELWMSQDGHIRLRTGKSVIFAYQGQVRAYDVASREVVEPDQGARFFIDKIWQAKEFSLEAIIEVMFGGRATEVTPLINPDAVISQDVVVFDVTLPDTPEWVRIWALRESRLPVRITIWDPRDGGSTDAIFMYAREQSVKFFDPNAFETLLQDRSIGSRVNVAYALLRDPGGRNITPQEMFARSGYHVPQVEQAGITPDGAVWIIAAKGQNRMPSGYTFFGFRRLQDDLGREYRLVYASHRALADQSTEVFAPADYPFDGRVPGKLILVCEVDDYRPAAKRETIGTVELTDWKQGQSWPEGAVQVQEWSFRTQMAGHHSRDKDYEGAERILATIPGQAGDGAAALERDRVRLGILVQQGRYEEAVVFGERLMPLLEDRYSKWHGVIPTPLVFCDYVRALACAGRLDQAKQTWAHLRAIQPELDPGLSLAAREHVAEVVRRDFERCLATLVPSLIKDGGLSAEQVQDILGLDVAGNSEHKELIDEAKRDAAWGEARKAGERYLSEVARRYEGRPLPDKAELVERADGEEVYLAGTGNDLPGHPGYKVLPVNYAVSGVVSNLRVIGADKSDARKVHPYQAAIRFADGAQDRELRADLVYRAGTELADCFHLVLAGCGMELATETSPARRVLVARYDGRKLKPNTEVHGPWHGDDGKGGTRSWRAADLLESLSQQIGIGVSIVDETELDVPLCLGDGTPQWQGVQGVEQARRWLQEQFGITLTEEARPITTYLVQRRTQ